MTPPRASVVLEMQESWLTDSELEQLRHAGLGDLSDVVRRKVTNVVQERTGRPKQRL